jgi:hypothetical protein
LKDRKTVSDRMTQLSSFGKMLDANSEPQALKRDTFSTA